MFLTDTGDWAAIGGTCGPQKAENYPVGCSGLALTIALEFQFRGEFEVEVMFFVSLLLKSLSV